MRAAAESPSSRRFPFTESLCFFMFFWRASSRWLPPKGEKVKKVSRGGLSGRTRTPRSLTPPGLRWGPRLHPPDPDRPPPAQFGAEAGGGGGAGRRGPSCLPRGRANWGAERRHSRGACWRRVSRFGAAWAPTPVAGGGRGGGERSGPCGGWAKTWSRGLWASPHAAEGREGPRPDPSVGWGQVFPKKWRWARADSRAPRARVAESAPGKGPRWGSQEQAGAGTRQCRCSGWARGKGLGERGTALTGHGDGSGSDLPPLRPFVPSDVAGPAPFSQRNGVVLSSPPLRARRRLQLGSKNHVGPRATLDSGPVRGGGSRGRRLAGPARGGRGFRAELGAGGRK